MDQFFAQILLLSEVQLFGMILLLTVAGGVLGAYFLTVEAKFRRVTFLWFLAVSNLVLMIVQSGWLVIPAAASAGMFGPFVLVMFLSCLGFGVVIYYGSAARSNDIDGSTQNAWMGFVPLINLYLLFTRGDGSAENREGSASDAMSIAGALLVFGLSGGISRGIENASMRQTGSSPELESILGEAQTLEERFIGEAEASSRLLPIRVDLKTVFSSIEAEGTVLRMVYDVDEEIDGLDPNIKRKAKAEMCKPDMFAADLRRGGRLVYVYKGPAGKIIDEFEITAADCQP